MSFWKLDHVADSVAIIDVATGRQKTYADLRKDVSEMMAAFPAVDRKLLVLLLAQNRYECLVTYLAALNSGHALLMADAAANSELLLGLINTYNPDLILSVAEIDVPGYSAFACPGLKALCPQNSRETHIHDDLA